MSNSAASAPNGSSEFTIVRGAPTFTPQDYAATFAELQLPSASGKLLDLASAPARLLCDDLFSQLAEVWTARPHAVPRLGILLAFERWALLRDPTLIALRPLVARGIRVEVFYPEQVEHLSEWFARGRVIHNVGAVVATLATRWHPTASWPLVLDTLRRLAHAHASASDLPALLTQIASLALSCGGAMQATLLAREALFHLPEGESATRCQALRELGTALICQEEIQAGVAILEEASAMAGKCNAADVGASSLCRSGVSALNHGDYAGAERRFRSMISLLPTADRGPPLLAFAYHHLAVALMHQRRLEDAEHHARTALALRSDPTSRLAEEDSRLLARVDQLRYMRPESHHLTLGSAPELQSHVSEVDP